MAVIKRQPSKIRTREVACADREGAETCADQGRRGPSLRSGLAGKRGRGSRVEADRADPGRTEQRIREVAAEHGLDISGFEIVDAAYSQDSAAKAVELVREGRAEALMKGSLHTDELMGAVVKRDTGLRTARRISHCFVMDVPDHDQPLIITDAAVNIAPDLKAKVDIIQNAIDLAHAWGSEVRVAILSAMETVNPDVPSTLEAAALCKMADRGQITGRLLDGPLALDNAISPEAARIKKIASPVAGAPSCWCRIWKPATCWPRACPSSPMRTPRDRAWREGADHPDQPGG